MITDGFLWNKKTAADPLRGLTDDYEPIPEPQRHTAAQKVTQSSTAAQKVTQLEPYSCLEGYSVNGHVGPNCYILPCYLKKHSCTKTLYQFQVYGSLYIYTTGAHFIEFNAFKLESSERPEDQTSGRNFC